MREGRARGRGDLYGYSFIKSGSYKMLCTSFKIIHL